MLCTDCATNLHCTVSLLDPSWQGGKQQDDLCQRLCILPPLLCLKSIAANIVLLSETFLLLESRNPISVV